MTESIDVYRASGIDEDGNPVEDGPLKLWRSFDAYVTPSTASAASTAIDPTSTGVLVGYTVYLRRADPSGILDTDVIGVRGRKLPVDGFVAQWRSQDGTYRGEQFSVTVKRG